jgi:hypothetical protein
MWFEPSKAFINTSESIADHFQVPTRLTITEEGIRIEVGGLRQLPEQSDLTRVKTLEDRGSLE